MRDENLNWGKIVQCLLRVMDHPLKGENSREQAERMADSVIKLFNAPAVTNES